MSNNHAENSPSVISELVANNSEFAAYFQKFLYELPDEMKTKGLESVSGYIPGCDPEDLFGNNGSSGEILETTGYQVFWAKDALMPIPPIDWRVDNLFPSSGVAVIFGDGGAKKTYTMLDLCACIALGKKWLGHDVKQGTVLFVDEESGPSRGQIK